MMYNNTNTSKRILVETLCSSRRHKYFTYYQISIEFLNVNVGFIDIDSKL